MKRYDLVVRDEAQDETEEIKAWYEAQHEGLGERFTEALEAAYKHIQLLPNHQVRYGIYRHARIEGFPLYRIVFVVDDETITIYQVRHTSRKPSKKFGP